MTFGVKKAAAPVSKFGVKKAAAPATVAKFGVKKAAAPVSRFGKKASSNGDEDGDGVRSRKGPMVAPAGWNAADKLKKDTSSYANRVTMEPGSVPIKFIEDGPYTSVAVHWLNHISYTCLGAKCPMCKAGVDRKVSYLFNVIRLTDAEPVHESLEAGTKLYDDIKEFAIGKTTKPLSKRWYILTRKGVFLKTKWSIRDVRVFPGDIAEMFDDIVIPSAAELAEFLADTVLYTAEGTAKTAKTEKELRAALSESDDDDEDDDDDDEDDDE